MVRQQRGEPPHGVVAVLGTRRTLPRSGYAIVRCPSCLISCTALAGRRLRNGTQELRPDIGRHELPIARRQSTGPSDGDRDLVSERGRFGKGKSAVRPISAEAN